MNKYEYNIDSKELIPKSGDNKYYAEVILFRIFDGKKYIPFNHDFQECLGITKDQAESKMHERVQKWITANP